MLAGLLIGLFVQASLGEHLERAGVSLMLGTSVVRVGVAGIFFLRERDWNYGPISFGVLTILLLSALFRNRRALKFEKLDTVLIGIRAALRKCAA